MTRTILEFTGQTSFGYSFDSLQEGSEEHPYAASLKGFMYVIPVPHKYVNCLIRGEQRRRELSPRDGCPATPP
jgi:hypothetical protein